MSFLWLFGVATACVCSGREPGFARRATHFLLLRQKKVSKEKATLSLRPLRFAAGQTCAGAVAGCAAELAVLLRSAARTAAASQLTKQPRTCATATLQPPRRRRSQKGVRAEQPNSHTGRRCARPGMGRAGRQRRLAARGACAREPGPSEAMARMDVRSPIPSVCAEERRAWGGVCRRAHASWTDSLRLSERSAAGAQRVPQRAPRTSTDSGVALSLVTFFRRRERKLLARRATPGLRPEKRHAAATSNEG